MQYTFEQREIIAENLRGLRNAYGYSLTDLQIKGGISKSTSDKYEWALGSQMKVLDKFCKLYGVDMEYLLTPHEKHEVF